MRLYAHWKELMQLVRIIAENEFRADEISLDHFCPRRSCALWADEHGELEVLNSNRMKCQSWQISNVSVLSSWIYMCLWGGGLNAWGSFCFRTSSLHETFQETFRAFLIAVSVWLTPSDLQLTLFSSDYLLCEVSFSRWVMSVNKEAHADAALHL